MLQPADLTGFFEIFFTSAVTSVFLFPGSQAEWRKHGTAQYFHAQWVALCINEMSQMTFMEMLPFLIVSTNAHAFLNVGNENLIPTISKKV